MKNFDPQGQCCFNKRKEDLFVCIVFILLVPVFAILAFTQPEGHHALTTGENSHSLVLFVLFLLCAIIMTWNYFLYRDTYIKVDARGISVHEFQSQYKSGKERYKDVNLSWNQITDYKLESSHPFIRGMKTNLQLYKDGQLIDTISLTRYGNRKNILRAIDFYRSLAK